MALRPQDMLEIQSAIDEYERKFPRRPPPSAEVALAWRLGKREAAKRRIKTTPELAGQECGRLAWAWEQLRLQWHIWTDPKDDDAPPRDTPMLPLVKGVLLVGGWSVFAVLVASIFFFGALVGGFK